MTLARLERADFNALLDALTERGYTPVGPVKREQAIIYDELESADDLPIGWGDEQEPGKYRLRKRDDAALFGYNMGPQSWKKFLFPPRHKLWDASKTKDGFTIEENTEEPPPYAFIGVRGCELAAIQIQDAVFMGSGHQDSVYAPRRKKSLVIAVNCSQAAQTCFCTSMDTGPKVREGFDIALTEIIDGQDHYFTAEAGSDIGKEILASLPTRDTNAAEAKASKAQPQNAAAQITRRIDTDGIKELFYNNYESPLWDDVADRCLSCANCTLACPTCFCSTTTDTTDLSGDHAGRWREWDSCFTADFSYIHGGSVRPSTKSRYRQWITHKLATWIDQFGSSGCVGCGRCIAWCPVGIDITEEAQALRDSEKETTNG